MKQSRSIVAKRAPISTAEKLLVLCAQHGNDVFLRQQASSLLSKAIDWECFIDGSVRQKIIASVYSAVCRIITFERIPSFVSEDLRNAYLYIVARTSLQHAQALHILKLCAQAGIIAVPLKGTILAKHLYGHIYLRDVSSDIDLFIQEKDILRLRDVLVKEGYNLRLRDNDEYCGYNEFMKAGCDTIDVRWKIIETIDCTKLRLEGFWKSVQPAEEGGVRFGAFAPEELLLYLCAHSMNKHCFSQLRHLCDIHQLLAVHGAAICWKRIIETASLWKLSGSLYYALSMREHFFKTPVAPEIRAALKISKLKSALLAVFMDEKVLFRRQCFRRRLLDRFLSFIFFRFFETRSLRDYCFFIFPPRLALRGKSYFTMFWRGFVKLASVFAR